MSYLQEKKKELRSFLEEITEENKEGKIKEAESYFADCLLHSYANGIQAALDDKAKALKFLERRKKAGKGKAAEGEVVDKSDT